MLRLLFLLSLPRRLEISLDDFSYCKTIVSPPFLERWWTIVWCSWCVIFRWKRFDFAPQEEHVACLCAAQWWIVYDSSDSMPDAEPVCTHPSGSFTQTVYCQLTIQGFSGFRLFWNTSLHIRAVRWYTSQDDPDLSALVFINTLSDSWQTLLLKIVLRGSFCFSQFNREISVHSWGPSGTPFSQMKTLI